MDVIVTVDTEADGQWEADGRVRVQNLDYVPRFQRMSEEYGIVPVYLCTYEVMVSRRFDETLAYWAKRGSCEIGAHLHPWTNPPYRGGADVVDFDRSEYPGYPSELPLETFRAKMAVLTDLIRVKTGRPPRSYRAGRWGFCKEHIAVLRELGYTVDCSVTPHVDRRGFKGVAQGGPDFRGAPVTPYELSDDDICASGTSGLLEVPVTIVHTQRLMRESPRAQETFGRLRRFPGAGLVNRALKLEPTWFRPYPTMNARRMRKVYEVARELELPCLEMMFHSSELMPGGSESFPTASSIERLFAMLESTFAFLAARGCTGISLGDFAEKYTAGARKRA